MIGQKSRSAVSQIVILFFLSIGALTMLGPFIWMFLSTIKPSGEILSMPPKWIPSKIVFTSYVTVLRDLPIGTWYLNSILVTAAVTLTGVFTSTLAGFVFSKYKWFGREFVFILLLSTMMIPFEIKLIPLYKFVVDLHLNNTYFGLLIPGLTSTFGIFMMRQFMHGIPDDLIEAGIIDGFSNFRIYWSIMLPLIGPAIATLTIFTFMWNWDFFIWPLVLLDKPNMFTVPVGLASFLAKDTVKYNLLLTSATVTVIPVIIVFLLGQKYIIKGIALTGLK